MAPLADTLRDLLAADGDAVTLVLTGAMGQAHPIGKRDARSYIDAQRPVLLVWLGGTLDLGTLQAAADAGLPVVMVNMDDSALSPIMGFWSRGRARAILARTRYMLTVNEHAAAAFRAAGVPQARLRAGVRLEEPVSVLPYDEDDRREISDALNNRPVWLATKVTMDMVDSLIAAQRHATRRAHRLLLVVEAAQGLDGQMLVNAFNDQRLLTDRSSRTRIPQEANQVHVADSDGDLGLWLRLASVTFAGGTFSKVKAQDPFEIATLGSGLVHGPVTNPYGLRYARLDAAGAARPIADWTVLGRTVEDLLAPDRVAKLVTAGWDVASQGAEAAEIVVSQIRDAVDGIVA
ncbi:hypothetical protein [Loktanella sp. SALINAS62]|uniref:hypothetical protein n=1 Tax=Loktanella sp. SALINAS62 TaxID=2706124 RepID=UPI001B8AC59A|nr:hypothetical protein [Loktanella sp. SALINAS62]MBS1302323.1 hypothetical protein [Loktanella sp. SALINAS62]